MNRFTLCPLVGLIPGAAIAAVPPCDAPNEWRLLIEDPRHNDMICHMNGFCFKVFETPVGSDPRIRAVCLTPEQIAKAETK